MYEYSRYRNDTDSLLVWYLFWHVLECVYN